MCKGLLKSLFLFFLLCQGVSAAQTVYVHDQLRLGVRAEPNSNQTPIAVVKTGAALSVLDEQDGYLMVKTEAGVKGWVSKGYVSAEPPARTRLANLEKRHAALKKELDDLRNMLAESTEKVEAAEKLRSELMSENASLHEKLSQFVSEQNSKTERSYSWLYIPLLLIGLFVLGIYIGVRWYKDRVAEKIGGLEI